MSISSRIPPCTLREAQALLLSFKSRIEQIDGFQVNMDGSQPVANYSTQNSQGRRGGFSQGYRGRFGQQYHSNRGGRNFGRGGFFRERGGRFNNYGKPKCQVCFGAHTADKCFHRYEPNFTPNYSNNGSNQGNQNSFNHSNTRNFTQGGYPMANVAVANSGSSGMDTSQEICWFPDSGATNHLTYDLSNLNMAADYQGSDKVQIGNGTGLKNRGGSSQGES